MDLPSHIAGWLRENEATISAVVAIAVLDVDRERSAAVRAEEETHHAGLQLHARPGGVSRAAA
jgi:hypothetical protein